MMTAAMLWTFMFFFGEAFGAAKDPFVYASLVSIAYGVSGLAVTSFVPGGSLLDAAREKGFWGVMAVEAVAVFDAPLSLVPALFEGVSLGLSRVFVDSWPIVFVLFLRAPKSARTWMLLGAGYAGYSLMSIGRGADYSASFWWIALAGASVALSVLETRTINWNIGVDPLTAPSRILAMAAGARLCCGVMLGAAALQGAPYAERMSVVPLTAAAIATLSALLLSGGDILFYRAVVGGGPAMLPAIYVRPLVTVALFSAGAALFPSLWEPVSFSLNLASVSGAALVAAVLWAAAKKGSAKGDLSPEGTPLA